jgi:hypothetical protein
VDIYNQMTAALGSKHPAVLAMGAPPTLRQPDQTELDRQQSAALLLARKCLVASLWNGASMVKDTLILLAVKQCLRLMIADAYASGWAFDSERKVVMKYKQKAITEPLSRFLVLTCRSKTAVWSYRLAKVIKHVMIRLSADHDAVSLLKESCSDRLREDGAVRSDKEKVRQVRDLMIAWMAECEDIMMQIREAMFQDYNTRVRGGILNLVLYRMTVMALMAADWPLQQPKKSKQHWWGLQVQADTGLHKLLALPDVAFHTLAPNSKMAIWYPVVSTYDMQV